MLCYTYTVNVIFFTAYAQQLDSLLAKKINELTTLRDKVTNFRKDIQEEETMSKNMKMNKKK